VSVRRTAAIALALAVALMCAPGGAVGAVGAAAPVVAGTQLAGCAKARTSTGRRSTARTSTARRRAAKRPARAARSARQRVAGRLSMSRKAQRSCYGFRPAKLLAAQPAASAEPPGAAAPGAVAPGAGPSAPSAPPPPGGVPTAPVASTLGVSAYDSDGFVLRMTRTSVPAGNLTIFFRNHDVSDHNLWIEGPGGDVVERISDTVGEDGGASRTLAVTPGAWRLFCALPDHGAMTRTLTVTG
jgi:plastocyanin